MKPTSSLARKALTALAVVLSGFAMLGLLPGSVGPAGAGPWYPEENPGGSPPEGFLESAQRQPSGIHVKGWAVDPDSGASINVAFRIGGILVARVPANVWRPDVGPHGFDAQIPARDGAEVCAWAEDSIRFADPALLGCMRMTVLPFGSFEAVSRVPGGVRVQGWALDPDSADPIIVDVSVNGSYAGGAWADRPRPDVAAAHPGYGDRHGLDAVIPVPALDPKGLADVEVCLWGINVGHGGTNPRLGCRMVRVTDLPFGAFEFVGREPGGVRVRGWAVDPNSADPIIVDAGIDGTYAGGAWADRSRPDIAAAHPGYGDRHGLDALIPARPGSQVCLWAINVGAGGSNPQIGCKAISLRTDPFGAFESIAREPGGIRVRGWAVDPDSAAPIIVDWGIDGTYAGGALADRARADVASANPGYGDRHGLDAFIPDRPGKDICLWAINVGHGTHTMIGCKPIPQLPAAPTNLTVTAPHDADVAMDVSFQDNASNETGFRLERSTAGGSWTTVRTFAPQTGTGGRPAHRDWTVSRATQYCYRVVAYNANGDSGTAGPSCATSLLPPTTKPSGLSVSKPTRTSMTLTWTDNATDEDGYLIGTQHPDGWRSSMIGRNDGTGPMSFTVTGLTPGTSYCFEAAVSKVGHVPAGTGTPACAKTEEAPIIVSLNASPTTVYACSPSTVGLAWDVRGVSRVTVTRGTTTIANVTAPAGGGAWQSSVTDPTPSDSARTYTLTTYDLAGVVGPKRDVTVSFHNGTGYNLVKSIRLDNASPSGVTLHRYSLNDYPMQQIGTLASGASTTIRPTNCEIWRIKAIDGRGLVRWEWTVVGYTNGTDHHSWFA